MTQREIKFRAMRDDMNPSWVYGSLLYGGDIPRIQELPLFSLFTTCLKGTEGQFTGLQDRQGKDIYEGDVVKDDMGRIMKAGYHNLRPCWIAISATNFHHADFVDWSKWDNEIDGYSNTVSVEVIGNIYENPELLK